MGILNRIKQAFTRKKNNNKKRNNATAMRRNNTNIAARNFVNQRIHTNFSGNQILAQAPTNMKMRVRKQLVNMGML